MTDFDEYDEQFLPNSPYNVHTVRSVAKRCGYYTPGALRVRLGVARWQWQVATWRGVLPPATATDRAYLRWPYDLVEKKYDELRQRVLETAGEHPPLGAHKAAVWLTERTTLSVEADDVHELERLHDIVPLGEWYNEYVYDVRDLALIDVNVLRVIIGERPRRLRQRQTLRRDQVEKMMGIRTSDFDHVIRRKLLVPTHYERTFIYSHSVRVPYFRASDVDDLLAGSIDWQAVRDTPKGRRSLLAGDDPVPTKVNRVRREALEELARRHATELAELMCDMAVSQSLDTTDRQPS